MIGPENRKQVKIYETKGNILLLLRSYPAAKCHQLP